jgi:hypothetical protein
MGWSLQACVIAAGETIISQWVIAAARGVCIATVDFDRRGRGQDERSRAAICAKRRAPAFSCHGEHGCRLVDDEGGEDRRCRVMDTPPPNRGGRPPGAWTLRRRRGWYPLRRHVAQLVYEEVVKARGRAKRQHIEYVLVS